LEKLANARLIAPLCRVGQCGTFGRNACSGQRKAKYGQLSDDLPAQHMQLLTR
jgi:hypothetical protein